MADEMSNGVQATAGGGVLLTPEEIDTIGEILNISMGSAATAVSTMLDKQVVITTPKVEIKKFAEVDYGPLEPAMLVRIHYVEGISGSNVMVFRQSDMQVILNLLMGNEEAPSDDFVFDELSMSAACEVMNQMMGSAATALSEFLGKTINISTPEATVMDEENTFKSYMDVDGDSDVVAVSFSITIEGVMDSHFVSVMTCQLAREIVDQVMGIQQAALDSIPAAPAPAAPPAAPQPAPQQPAAAAAPPAAPQPMGQPAAAGGYPQQPAMGAQPPMGQPPAAQPPAPDPAAYGQQPYPYPPYPQAPYGQQPAYPYPPYGYGMPPYGQPPQPAASNVIKQPVQVQTPQFPTFMPQGAETPASSANMDLLMGVSLNVSVEIGKTKRKIKEIVDFGQGTVIELDKQAGAPVDIIVNGRLIARGDVVVIDDNFGVRITEIVGTRELLETLESEL